MKLLNILQMNDWEMKIFIRFFFAIQLAFLGITGLELFKIEIPILGTLICFFYLTLIPGYIILRILRLHSLGTVKSALCAIGLSISFLMIFGLFINYIYPILGIAEPLSTISLLISINIGIITLFYLGYIRDRKFSNPTYLSTWNLLSPTLLILYLTFLLAILGAYYLAYYNQNILLVFAFILISILFIVISLNKKFLSDYYALAIFIFAISILYGTILVSPNLTGSDVHRQYFYSYIVIQNNYWNPLNFNDNVNQMASITILPIIYSKILHFDLTLIFKIIYPIFFSLVPVCLYELYTKYCSKLIAFLASFFFISFYVFFNLYSMTQYLGEFFLVLLLLIMFTSEHVKRIKIVSVSLIFSISMIISHYGTTYLFLFFYLLGGFIIFWILNILRVKNLKNKIKLLRAMAHPLFRINFILIFFILVFSWYYYIGQGSSFKIIIWIGETIYNNLNNLFSPATQSADIQMALGAGNFSILRTINWFLFIISIFFIAIGLIRVMFKRSNKYFNFRNEWNAMAIVSILILIISIVVSNFAVRYNFERLFHLTLIFLSPFVIIGSLQIFELIKKYLKQKLKFPQLLYLQKNKFNYKVYITIIFVFLFFFFNTGIIYEITGDTPVTVASISKERIKDSADPNIYYRYYFVNWSYGDIEGARWISTKKGDYIINADFIAGGHVLRSYGLITENNLSIISSNIIENNGYFYLFELNFIKGFVPIPDPVIHNKVVLIPLKHYDYKILYKNKIYSNGDVIILK